MRSRVPPVFLSLVVAACSGATATDFFDKTPTSTSKADAGGLQAPSPTTTDPSAAPTDAPDAAPPPPSGKTCSQAKDCGGDLVCVTASCGGDGACVDPATLGDQPVCGCDKLTYASVGLLKGVARHAGACERDEGTACSTTNGCSGGAKCNLPLSDALSCASPGQGACWRLPNNCPTAPRSFRSCGGVSCVSACEAAQSGRGYYKALSCP